MRVENMIAAHPNVGAQPREALVRCIEECFSCAQICTACADACLGEKEVARLVDCIRLDLDCADLCLAAGTIASRRSGCNPEVTRVALHACAIACTRCGDECAKHAQMHEHCRICAEACRSCAEACRKMTASLQDVAH